MKKTIISILCLLVCYSSIADNIKSFQQCITISQSFIGQGECKPSFGNSFFYYNEYDKNNITQNLLQIINCTNTIIQIVQYDSTNNCFRDTATNDVVNCIIVKSFIKDMANDDVAFFDYDLSRIDIGVNLKTVQASDPCYNWFNDFRGGNRNSYTLTTNLIKDVPIEIEELEKTKISVDDGDVLKLKFKKFYQNSKDNRKLQVKVNYKKGNSNWVDLKLNAGKQITSEGEIEISFDEIVKSVCGNGDSFDSKYNECTARMIEIRAVKKLLDGVHTHGNIVSCQFFKKGPDFEILKIRNTSCKGATIEVRIKKADIEKYKNNGFEWRIKPPKGGTSNIVFNLTYNDIHSVYDGEYAIVNLGSAKDTVNKQTSLSLMSYLKDHKFPNDETWEMQMAITDNDSMIFDQKPFTIPKRIDTIAITPDYVTNNNENNDANNPYLLLEKIDDDDDTRPEKRLPYYVECGDKDGNYSHIYTINSPKEDNLSIEELKAQFNSEKSKYSFYITENGYIQDTFCSWYDKQSVEIKSTIKIGKAGNKPTKYNWDINHYERKNNGYDVILRTTHDEKNGNGKYETYTYLCKFRIEDKNNFDRIPSSASYIKFKGDDVATHITSQVGINSLSYALSYVDQSVDGGLKISYQKTVTENGNSSLRTLNMSVDINSAGNLVQYIGKGNGYYLVKMLEGGTGLCMLIDMSTFHAAIGFQSINASDFEDYDTTYVVNENLLACKDEDDDVYVWHDNEFYNTYSKSSKPVFYSIEDKDGTGFTYWVNGEKYFRSYNSFSKNELYEYFKTNQVINCPSNSFDNAWIEYKKKRNDEFEEYLKFATNYKITNIPQTDYLKKSDASTLAYSGYLRIKDSDDCYSKPIEYAYYYKDDLSYNVVINQIPTSRIRSDGNVEFNSDGKVELVYNSGSNGPYKYIDGKSEKQFDENHKITIENLTIGEKDLEFKNNKEHSIKRKIQIPTPFDCEALNITCKNDSGSIIITKRDDTFNPNSIILYRSNKYHKAIETPSFTNSKQEIDVSAGDYDVYITYENDDTHNIVKINQEKLQVSEHFFSISTENFPAEVIGGSGKVTITAENADGDIKFTWVDDYGNTTSTTENSKDMPYTKESSGNLKITATHNNCSVTTEYPYESPKIKIEEAKITYCVDESSNTQSSDTLHIISSGEGNIDNYTFYLVEDKGNLTNNAAAVKEVALGQINKTGDLSFSSGSEKKYYLYVVYTIKDNSEEKVELLTSGFEPPVMGGDCEAVAYSGNSTRCYATDGKIQLKGQDCKYSVDNVEVKKEDIDNKGMIYRASGLYTVNIIKASDVNLNYCLGKEKIEQKKIKTQEVTVVGSHPLEYGIKASNVTCYNKGDGKIAVFAKKNAHGDISFAIKNGETTVYDFDDSKDDIKLLPSPSYNILIQDNGCPNYTYTEKYEISQPAEALRFESITTTDPTCWNDDGKIEVVVKGGWNEYKGVAGGYYNIVLDEDPQQKELEESSFNSTENVTFEGLEHKDYTIYATDYENCTISKDVTLYKYVNPKITGALFDSVWCYGGNNGNIKNIEFTTDDQVSVVDPMKMYYSTNPAKPSVESNWIDYSPTINNLKSDDYYIWLKDTNQCVSDNPFYITVRQPDSLILSINDENNIIREYGKPGGSVNVNVSGGNKGTFNIFLDTKKDTLAQVIWGNHAFNDIFRPGTHKLYVTDHKECIDSATTKQMRQPDSPLSIEATPHDALCNGSFGSITVRGSGGWNGYQYSCSSKSNLYGANQNEYTFYDIKGGYYEVSVTDAEGVTATQKVYVNTPPKLMAVPQLRASSCKNDGLISANITGGTMPYLVKPDSSSVTPFYFEPYITNCNLTIIPKQLAAGDYSIVVVDSNNCEILMSATIADSSVKATVKPVYPTAHEFANGRLEAVVQQGPAPYTYQWKNHNTGETCTNAVWDKVGAGVYSLDVTDANNCSVSVPITYLATNGDLPLIIDTIIGETAVGACNGMAKFTSDTTGFKSITLHGNSGVEKDVTSMVNNKLQFELTGLAPDSYLLECVLADTTVRYAKFTIARYEPMHLIVSNIVDVSKQDAANGSAKLRIDGGRAPFIVQMLRGDDFLADTVLNDRNLPMSGLTAANYTVSVVDESDNRINTQFIIRKPEKPLRLQAQSVENPSCNGYTNGRIILKATGGWGDYEYAAAEGEFGRATAYDGRGAAVHTFVAIDSKGITDTLKVELVEPLPLTARVVQVDSVSCFGLTDGSVTFDIAGGTAPYTVHYDDFFDKKSNFVGSLNAGTHTFNITDSNFCRAVEGSLAVDIPQPGVLQVVSDSVVHTTCNTDNGRIFITIAGGTAPYANSWREDGLIKERFANLTAIDSLQGYSLYEVEVADAKGCKTGKSYRINPSSGPKIERVRTLPVLCYGDSTGTAVIDSADIVPATPYSPFRIEWPHGENAMSVGNLPAGWNVVFVIDSNNCKSGTGFNVDAPSPVEIRKIGSRDASCYGYADGRISTLTLGGVGGYRYQWSNGDTLPDIDSIAKGSYTIVVADRNNCRDSAVFAIGQPDSLHVEIGEENVLMCPDNTYEFIPTDGFKTYRWILNDSTLSDKRNLIASEQGEYHLVATYGANCISRDTVTITIGDDLLEADFYMASDASKDNTIALVELSNMKTDSIRWDFSATDFEIMDSSLYELQLKPNTIGRHNITLWAYSSGCVSYITKQVEISELPDTTDNIKLGYDPLIKSVTVKPNPTNGLFRVDVQLRENHDAEMTISSVSHGTQIEQRKLAGDAEYSESFDLSNASDGVYILRIAAGNEQRLAKVLITK